METGQTSDDNKTLKAFEKCKTSDNVNFKKTCDDSELLPKENDTNQGDSREVLKEPTRDSANFGKTLENFLHFTDSKDIESTNTCQENLPEVLKKVNLATKLEKRLRFSEDSEDTNCSAVTKSKSLKKKSDRDNYPIVSYTEEDEKNFSR